MKNLLFLVFGVLFWVYCAATCLETLKKTIHAFLSSIEVSDRVSLQFPDEQVKFGFGFRRH